MIFRNLLDPGVFGKARIDDEDVDASLLGPDLLEDAPKVGAVACVGLYGTDSAGAWRVGDGVRHLAAGGVDQRPLAGEALRKRPAYAAYAADNEGDLVLQSAHGETPSKVMEQRYILYTYGQLRTICKADIESIPMSAMVEERPATAGPHSPPRRPKPVSAEALIDVQKVRPVLEQIANKWSVLILTVLCSRPSRFNEIMRRLDGITHKRWPTRSSGWNAMGSFGARFSPRRRRSVSNIRSPRLATRFGNPSKRSTNGHDLWGRARARAG